MTIDDYLESDYRRVAETMASLGIENKRILVTGATGMIGSFVVASFLYGNKELGLDNTVIAVCRNRKKLEDKLGPLYRSSNLEIEVVPDISAFQCSIPSDYVIHTACNTDSSRMVACPVETIDGIYSGTRSVLEYARGNNVQHVVFLSSMEVYGTIAERVLVDEKSPLGPLDPSSIRSGYPMAKRLAENLCISYGAEYNLNISVLRLAQTFGIVAGYDSRFFYQLIEAARDVHDIVLHTGGIKMNNFCYLCDAVVAMLFALKKSVGKGEIYNVADMASSMTILDMANLVAGKIMQNRISVIIDADDDIARKYSPQSMFLLDSGKLGKLGWHPLVDLEEALRRNIQSEIT